MTPTTPPQDRNPAAEQSAQKASEQLITYRQNDERKTMRESQALFMLETIAQTDLARALAYYHKLTEENPQAEQLLKAFYQLLLNMFMLEELLQVTSARLKRVPSCTTAFSWKMNALQHMFRNHEAIDILNVVAQANPDNVLTRNSLGEFQRDVGNFEAAKACFDKATELDPSFARAYWNASAYSTDAEADLGKIKSLISGTQVPEKDIHNLHFCAYRHYESLEQFEDAFEHLQIANGLKRRAIEYDVDVELAIDENAKTVFTPERLRSLEAGRSSEFQPIFIMGMPRSGTTLIEQIIASHSEVSGGDEYTALASAVSRAQLQSSFAGPVDQWLSSRATKDWHEIGKLYEHNTRFIRGDKKVFTDKNQFNHRSIGIIKASLANAKIIMVDRNPMDVAFACYRQLFNGQGAKFSYQIDELVKIYASYLSLMEYWETHTNNLIMRINYEDLVTDQVAVSTKLLNFCGLELEQGCIDFHKTQRTVKTLSASQVRQAIFTQGIDRWKQYESQLEPMRIAMQKAGLI